MSQKYATAVSPNVKHHRLLAPVHRLLMLDTLDSLLFCSYCAFITPLSCASLGGKRLKLRWRHTKRVEIFTLGYSRHTNIYS